MKSLLRVGPLVSLAFLAAPAQAVTLGQIETFDSGEAMWSGSSWASSGGPAGANDAYLVAGSNLWESGIYALTRTWDGDYVAAGIDAVEADLINLGTTDLNIRLYFYTASPSLTGRFVSIPSFGLAPGQGWQHVRFGLSSSEMTPDPFAALHVVSAIGFAHQLSPTEIGATPAIGMFGIDNITLVPEPASPGLLLGLATLWARARRGLPRP